MNEPATQATAAYFEPPVMTGTAHRPGLRSQGKPTLPSSCRPAILIYRVYLRTRHLSWLRACRLDVAGLDDSIHVLAALRQ